MRLQLIIQRNGLGFKEVKIPLFSSFPRRRESHSSTLDSDGGSRLSADKSRLSREGRSKVDFR